MSEERIRIKGIDDTVTLTAQVFANFDWICIVRMRKTDRKRKRKRKWKETEKNKYS